MATIKNFEEIEAWQKARELSRAVYSCSGKGELKLISGFMNYLKQSGLKGQKFKKP